jgi:hypothetical protein
MKITDEIKSAVTSAYYQIAGLWCQIDFSEKAPVGNLLSSCEPFRCNNADINRFACKINVVENYFQENITSYGLLSEASGILGQCLRLYENESKYLTVISFEDEKYRYMMVSNKDFSESTVHIRLNDLHAGETLNSFFMVAFSQMAVLHQTVLIHASVIEKENLGFAFLGKSGTGKSTHSSLWLRYIAGSKLLNDDNPALQINEEGDVFIYGTPWSGKTPCYINKKVELAALVRLQQAPENLFSETQGLDSMVALLPSCSSLRWNSHLYTSLCDVLERVIQKTPVCILKCLPNHNAAEICYEGIQELRLKQTLIK